jgi:hypothetical protein
LHFGHDGVPKQGTRQRAAEHDALSADQSGVAHCLACASTLRESTIAARDSVQTAHGERGTRRDSAARASDGGETASSSLTTGVLSLTMSGPYLMKLVVSLVTRVPHLTPSARYLAKLVVSLTASVLSLMGIVLSLVGRLGVRDAFLSLRASFACRVTDEVSGHGGNQRCRPLHCQVIGPERQRLPADENTSG